MRIVSSSTSASETLTSPATTRPLSSTRSRTSTRPVARGGPSDSVGIGRLFYEINGSQTVKLEQRAGCTSTWRYLSNGDASVRSAYLVWNGSKRLERRHRL